jgi:hypothetical protein
VQPAAEVLRAPGDSIMTGKERRKYHGTHLVYRRPRNWVRCFREGWLDGTQPGMRRQRIIYRDGR